MNNKFYMEFPALACNEAFARMVVSGFVMELDPTCEELSEIKTAVSEAVTNAIIHGYDEKGGTVYFEGEISGKTVMLKISDKGKGIENIPLARTPLYTGVPGGERSGMGFTIMEAFMDKLEIISKEDEGTTVVLTKILLDEGEVVKND